ncbi:LOW QUALITY PROTEIN: hypothetical protein BRADI_2g48663v3 [Brachypodium distachyon]|uniref:Uncharacterized protein n=1 Tax=Brachypodium distachyon TaxID=15368 RepID=A0A0Q3GEE3_BRADI|nr:LOW QUALITY PROTEIN: hypothetical protein BRADI_2g48663v3 [Brachypodium distachyon]
MAAGWSNHFEVELISDGFCAGASAPTVGSRLTSCRCILRPKGGYINSPSHEKEADQHPTGGHGYLLGSFVVPSGVVPAMARRSPAGCCLGPDCVFPFLIWVLSAKSRDLCVILDL